MTARPQTIVALSAGFVLLIVMGLVLGAFAVTNWPATLSSDEGTYMVQALLLDTPHESGGALEAMASYRQLPPFFSWLLMVTESGGNWARAHFVVLICWMLALTATWSLLWVSEQGRGPWRALVTMIITATAPTAVLLSKYVASEALFLLLSALTLILFRFSRNRPWMVASAGVAAGLSFQTRSIGLALVLAVIIGLLFDWGRKRRKPTDLAYFLIGMTIPVALLANTFAASEYSSIWEFVMGRYMSSQGDAFHYIAANMRGLRDGWVQLFRLEHEPLMLSWWPVALGTLSTLGAVVLAIKGQVLGVYLITYSAVVVLWPFSSEYARFLLPVFPFAFWAALDLLRVLPGQFLVVSLVTLLTMTQFLPVNFENTWRYAHGRGVPAARMADYYHFASPNYSAYVAEGFVRVFEDFERVGETSPEGAVIIGLKPHFGYLFSGRRFVLTPDPRGMEIEEYVRTLCRTGTHWYVSRLTRPDRPPDMTLPVVENRAFPSAWERHADDGDVLSALLVIRGSDKCKAAE